MARGHNRPPTTVKATADAVGSALKGAKPSAGPQQVVHAQFEQVQQYSGQIPPPALLRDFDNIAPGTALRLIQWAEDEQAHRRRQEAEALAANIAAQQRQLDIAEYQTKAVKTSDLIGQALGFLVCASCIGGAVWLGLAGQTGVAVALTVIPSAAVVYAFRGRLFGGSADKPADKPPR